MCFVTCCFVNYLSAIMNSLVWVVLVAVLSYGLVKFVFLDKSTIGDNFAPTVQLNGGKVRGRVLEVNNGKRLHFYEGIRFGESNRFEKSQPVQPWSGVYDATSAKTSCPQPMYPGPESPLFQIANQSENCLFLNVWKPVEESNQARPVMVFIHGGAYMSGTIFAKICDGQYIASGGDVIVVSISYRLGPFGFLHGGDVKGNMGLLDQILGLKWVQENIHHFGGDPNVVTIFGSSAGSLSVGSLVLTPLTKGLFKRAILMGGAPNSVLGAISKTTSLTKTKNSALKLNCSTKDIDSTIACLRSKPVDQIVSLTVMDFEKDEFFSPIYGDEVFPVSPVEALRTGKFNRDIDVMFGVARDEGSFFVGSIFPKLLQQPENLTIESTRNDIVYIMDDIFKLGIGDEVAKFYTEGLTNPTDDELKITLSNVWGDFYLVCPTILFGEQLAKHQPANRYHSFRVTQRPLGDPNHQEWMGVHHGAESTFIFLNQFLQTLPDQQLGNDLIRAFTSFAKNGKPGKMGNVQWEEAFDRDGGEPNTKYLSANVDDYKMVGGFYRKTCDQFWKQRINQ